MSSRGGSRLPKRTKLRRPPTDEHGIDDAPSTKLPRRSVRIQKGDKKRNRPSQLPSIPSTVDNVSTANSIQVDTSDNSIEIGLGDSFLNKLTVEIDTTFNRISKITQIISIDEEDIIELNESSRIDNDAVVISDESDVEELPAYHLPDALLPPDISQPSTSYANTNTRSMSSSEAMEQLEEETLSPNLKKLQELQKETEELLKNTTASLEEFSTNKPKEPLKESKASVEISKSPGFTKTCPICLEPLFSQSTVSTICGHIYCEECIKAVIQRSKKCPTCRKGLTLKKIHPIYL